MSSKIIFNGKEYNNVDEMPADARQAYQQAMGVFGDANKNGIPDILEGGVPSTNIVMTTGQMQIVWDGKVYTSIDQLPPEAREKYQKAMGQLAHANNNGIPDIIAGVSGAANIVTSSGPLQIVHDGKVYTNMDELPPEAREKYQKALQALGDANQNGIPDIVEGIAANKIQIKKTIRLRQSSPQISDPAAGTPPPERDNGRLLAMAAIICFMLFVVIVLLGILIIAPMLARR
jgi:hypothetical protein